MTGSDAARRTDGSGNNAKPDLIKEETIGNEILFTC
jgi:hypothetical protein